jgi:hypothetical protein
MDKPAASGWIQDYLYTPEHDDSVGAPTLTIHLSMDSHGGHTGHSPPAI